MITITNAKVILPQGEKVTNVTFDEYIREIGDTVPAGTTVIDGTGLYLSAGFVDTHTHGYGGFDYSEGTSAELRTAAKMLPSTGVTGWLPTWITMPRDTMDKVIGNVREVQASQGAGVAQVLGLHAEGPYINPDRAGAQNRNCITSPDVEYVCANSDVIKLITVAPEMTGVMDSIDKMTSCGVRVSIGHSDATGEIVHEAVERGASRATHLFNAMRGMTSREPGVLGECIANPKVYIELIADCKHVSKTYFPVLTAVKKDKIILITDSLFPAGLEAGDYYEKTGRKIIYDGSLCYREDGVTIAGSAATMDRVVRNMSLYGNVSIADAVRMATVIPLRTLGIVDRGEIEVGQRADITLFDQDIQIKQTYVLGERAY